MTATGPTSAGPTSAGPNTAGRSTADRAADLRALHAAPELLVLTNVWDVASARTIAALPGTTAIATASHAIAESLGYEDGENIPRDLMLATVGRIAAAVELPVTADLEAGYGAAGETIRRAIAIGVAGGNLEDELRPLADAVAAVRDAVKAGEAEGVPFALNARTDAYLIGGDRAPEVVLADAIERGRAFLAEGATCVFVPGVTDVRIIADLVEGIGDRQVSLMAQPGGPTMSEVELLGVARVSSGPFPYGIALEALARAGERLNSGGSL